MTTVDDARPQPTHARWWRRAALVLLLAAFGGPGVVGVSRYVWNFWLYRGYSPPSRPSVVVERQGSTRHVVDVSPGTVEHITVKSPALGGASVPVWVYLPPGYFTHPSMKYPTMYLLHGFPGNETQFVDIGQVATLSDTLVAEGVIKPMILVMPRGTTSFFVDTEWANSIRPHSDWETFVARDLVSAIDHRYRAIRSGAARGIGGLSEGAYGALNIGFHHVGEFHLIEAWSPYFEADTKPVFFGRSARLLAYNSPAAELPVVAPRLRATHTFVWMYCGTVDYTTKGSRQFAASLAALHVPFHFAIYPGRHNWALWRSNMPRSLVEASSYLTHG